MDLTCRPRTVSKVYARHQDIITAGSVFILKYLKLSGISPADILKAIGVKVKKTLAAVGANLQDNHNANTLWCTQKLTATIYNQSGTCSMPPEEGTWLSRQRFGCLWHQETQHCQSQHDLLGPCYTLAGNDSRCHREGSGLD